MLRTVILKGYSIRPVLCRMVALALIQGSLLIVPKAVGAMDIIYRQLVKIAQTGDDPPNVTGPFTSFEIVRSGFVTQAYAPAVDETQRVAFVGRDANRPLSSIGNSGIFIGNGYGLITVADRSTNPLGIVGNFDGFSDPAISPFGVVFSGRDSLFRWGVFTDPSGATILRSMAQFGDEVPIPGSSDTFARVFNHNISGVYIAYSGDFPVGVANKSGIFVVKTITNSGSIVPNHFAVAITGDDPPGPIGPLASFGGFDGISNSGASVAFAAQDANFDSGIFAGSFPIGPSGSQPQRRLRTIVSNGDALPGRNGKFLYSGELDMDGRELVFRAYGFNEIDYKDGIYVADIQNGGIKKIVEQSEDAPGLLGRFENFHVPAISNSIVAFTANDANGNQGLYLNIDGTLKMVVDSFTVLDGKPIAKICLGAQGLINRSGIAGRGLTSLAFGVEFANGSQAIYRADLVIW